MPALVARARIRRATKTQSDGTLIDLERALDLVAETGAAAYEPFIREELGWLHHDETEWRVALQLYDKIGAPAQAQRLQAELDRR